MRHHCGAAHSCSSIADLVIKNSQRFKAIFFLNRYQLFRTRSAKLEQLWAAPQWLPIVSAGEDCFPQYPPVAPRPRPRHAHACTHACMHRRDARKYQYIFNTKTARKWHIDCMESQDSPALRKKGVKVVHVKQRKAGRILFKKTEITRFHPTDVFWWKLSQSKYFVEQKPPSDWSIYRICEF
jgi:hypothetical protein